MNDNGNNDNDNGNNDTDKRFFFNRRTSTVHNHQVACWGRETTAEGDDPNQSL